jgi:hypothetical protein
MTGREKAETTGRENDGKKHNALTMMWRMRVKKNNTLSTSIHDEVVQMLAGENTEG